MDPGQAGSSRPRYGIHDHQEQPHRPGRNNGGTESPESGSLYSDEIPSGYNSGEQYDTISTGYMSGEAYELPDTRLELREPALDVIEECIQPLEVEGIYRVPVVTVGTPVHMNSTVIPMDQEMENDMSSTSSGAEDNQGNDKDSTNSPILPFGKKHRKKATFSIPIEATPLSNEEDDIAESSDPGMGDAPTGGYRAVPSDTDTSAIDSDPNAHEGRHKRIGKRKRNLKNHDEAWFMSHDSKKWARIRLLCFWGSICCMTGAFILAAVMMAIMPRNCDPKVEWFQGKVFMDFQPKPGGLASTNLDEYLDDGIATLHLKGISEGKPTMEHVKAVIETLGSEEQIKTFVDSVHASNLTLLVQVPIVGDTDGKVLSLGLQHHVDMAIQFWMQLGADGIFLDGLEDFTANKWVAKQITSWEGLLDRYGTSENKRILMTSYKFAKTLSANQDVPEDVIREAFSRISLLDAHLDLDLRTNISDLIADMDEITRWDSVESRPWINWNMKVDKMSNAAVALQMLLPGTINLSPKGDEVELKNMTSLRAVAVPIYMNGNYKRCGDCEDGVSKEVNYIIHEPMGDAIQLERYYNRRNRYVLVANFGSEDVNLGPVGKIYSGGEVVLDTSKSLPLGHVAKFSSIELKPGEAIVIKLPK